MAGRERELVRIDSLLREATERRSGALLIVGEPGVGKTTLLEAARAQATSFTYLGTRGIEAESHVAYAGLFGLLNPIRDRVSDIADHRASALGSALARVEPRGERRAVPPGRRHPVAPGRGGRARTGAGDRGRPAVAGPGVGGRDRVRGAPARSGRRRLPAGGP
ncbi:ATP-binding protein [Nocardioides sp. B-3]|uniref:ATP-binding protein n=1 Tax=Nocardioides sp. B-3 TaxID=2895565 RepID=UPI002152459B|nr:ATP-binding protein [Nocardioides sp. B-3]UUZ60361.1 ATP-binding protein [Nocardioides sp. B-3]